MPLRCGRSRVVVAPERNDPRGVRGASQPRHAIGIETRAAYDMRRGHKPAANAALLDSDHLMTGQDLAAPREDALGKGAGNLPVIDDACRGRVQGFDPECVSLDLSQAFQALLIKLFQPGKLLLVCCHEDLTAWFVTNAMIVTKPHQPGKPGNAGSRLELAGGVVDAGMDDAAVVSRLVLPDGLLLFKDYLA